MSAGAYQHGRRQTEMPRQNDRAVLRYHALHDSCLLSADDDSDSVMLGMGLRLADQLEDGTQPSVYVDQSGDSDAKVKRERPRSLPAETEADTYDLPDLSPLSEESKTAECERSRYLSDTEPDHDSVSLLRAPDWTADTPTAGAQIETVL